MFDKLPRALRRREPVRTHCLTWEAVPIIWQTVAAAGAAKVVDSATKPKSPALPTPPLIPNQDAAANAASAQTDLMRKRRGVLQNIYAGGGAAAPQVATKATLG